MANGINGLSRVMEGPRPEVQCMGLRDAVPPITLATQGEDAQNPHDAPEEWRESLLPLIPDGPAGGFTVLPCS